MSGATLLNLLLDLNQFEYQELAERDVEQALRELQSRFSDSSSAVVGNRQNNRLPFSIDEDAIQKVMGYVHRGIEKVSGEGNASETKVSGEADTNKAPEKMVPCLFPPGTCIHFYRDGSGIDGTYVPCTFFDEVSIDDVGYVFFRCQLIDQHTFYSPCSYTSSVQNPRLMLREQWLMTT